MSRKTRGQEVWCGPITPGAAPAWLGRGRMPSLDGLRALAILMVIYAHGRFPFDDLLPLRALKGRCGFLGVQVFFVLSGFLITTLMLRERDRTGRLSLRGFYLRRVLRIVPAYASYLVMLAVLQGAGLVTLSGLGWLSLTTYTVNFLPSLPPSISHVWSLSVEEHFYLLWPLLMASCTLSGCRRVVLGVVAGALALRWLVLLAWPGGHGVDVWTFTRIDDIAMGCLLALLAREPSWRMRLDGVACNRWVLGTLLVASLASQACFSRLVGGRLMGHVPLALGIGATNCVTALAITAFLWAAVRRPSGAVGRVLNHPVAVWVGVLSYSLYLWHPLFCLDRLGVLASFPANLACMFVAASLSYLLVERPFLGMKDCLTGAADVPRRSDRVQTLPSRKRRKPVLQPVAR